MDQNKQENINNARALNGAEIRKDEIENAVNILDKISKAYAKKVVGQEELRLAMLVSLISGGHILLESLPGLAKTLAAKTLAESVNASFSRIQCTPDLLPSDIIGTQIYNYNTGKFETKVGPVNANFVLLDEINRSSAKTQSAMLEAMQERQVSIGGVRYEMPDPFLVIATQNPIEQEGTYELPQAQLDRFLLKEVINQPKREEEMQILNYTLSGATERELSASERVNENDVRFLQKLARRVRLDESIKGYILDIIFATRSPRSVIDANLARYVEYGVSPRGAIALMRVSQAIALINGRSYVTPDDVKRLRHAVLRHRVMLNFEAIADDIHSEAIIDAIFARIRTP